ncbi:hypothetical protein AMTRI_Chr12g269170 [Amborella trichopoda]|uniref:NPH3 domain-containing protein n=1 Tax=Amborella trichopoda TaxID=13333 RepID=W1P7H9_AMBTC|nr:BTB/POZ domain-containing protein At5g67385 [Amborella trichopoda]ERN03634.1 hypothetical protein AMTR_s00144p00020600 [Amborella trichopoda]|eukprot:XP_006841959.1 BTB/POZ domain-containing protein At5g67385 [Amborella trichopoda]
MVEDSSPSPLIMSTKKKQLLSSAMKRTSEWIFSQEIPSDVTVQAGGATFSLHKFPLVSKCGYMRKLVSEANDADLSMIEIPDIPGGAEAFELAAKFCYGINFEISTENVAMLRCVAEYLEMTEDYTTGNLVNRTEAYVTEVALKSLSGAITVLHRSESLLPMAEKVKLVSRCIDAVAYLTFKESQFSGSSRTDSQESSGSSSVSHPKAIVDWWADDLTVLRIDIFQRVLIALKARGLKEYALGPILMLYAQKSLRGLEIFGRGRKKIEPKQEHDKRVMLETIVSLLPGERNAMSVSFLSMLLRAAIYLDTTVACRLDLERRMGIQLDQAVLDDLLIPSYSFSGDTMFDVDTVQRILVTYLEKEEEGTQLENRLGYNTDDDYVPPLTSDLERVGRLYENYLAEIASDPNLSVSKFIGLVELIPEQSKANEDGIYRAIDIYLKAHASLIEIERKKVCSLMDCQKLSREACAHAAQNDRLPVQTVVQVLYYEQQSLRDAMNGNLTEKEEWLSQSHKANAHSKDLSPHNELLLLRRENEDLKLEMVKLRMRLKELEKLEKPPNRANKPPLPKKSLLNSMSKKLGKLYPFVRADGPSPRKAQMKPNKDRRHSIS